MTFVFSLLILLFTSVLPVLAVHAETSAKGNLQRRKGDLEDCTDLLNRKAYRLQIQESVTKKYEAMEFTTAQQNRQWIDHAKSGSQTRELFVEETFSRLKEFNDTVIGDRRRVTALKKLRTEIGFQMTQENPPDFDAKDYVDFKTRRQSGPFPGEAAVRTIVQNFVRANERFRNSSVLTQILREQDLKGPPLFQMGLGESADEASIAARWAKVHGGPNQVAYFADPELQADLGRKMERVKELYNQFEERYSQTEIFENDGRGGRMIKLEAFIAARKAQTPQGLRKLLRLYFPNLPNMEEAVGYLWRMSKLADEFSPSIYVAEPETLSIDEAPFGTISFDFIGLGAENLEATLNALLKAENLTDAVKLARAGEQTVTSVFNQRKAFIRRTMNEHFGSNVTVRFSGDDAVVIPTRLVTTDDQVTLLRKLSAYVHRPFFRMGLVHPSGQASRSMQLITQTDGVEKEFRKMIIDDLGLAFANNMGVEVMAIESTVATNFFLKLSLKSRISPTDKSVIENNFERAVLKAQAAAREFDPESVFEAVSISAIYPDTPAGPSYIDR